MIKRWRRIEEIGGDYWVMPIWNAIHASVNKGRMKKHPPKLGELALYISTKLNMIPHVVNRINKGSLSIWDEVKKRDKNEDSWIDREGYGLRIDEEIKYNLLIDLDCLIFELTSCLELMRQFLYFIYKHTNKKLNGQQKEQEFKKILSAGQRSNSWYDELTKHRNFFIHQGAPYHAIDLTNEGKFKIFW